MKNNNKKRPNRSKFSPKARQMAKENNFQDAFADEVKFKASKSDKQTASKKFPQGSASTNNDAAWYAKNPQLLKDSASFSYNNPLGAPFRMDDYFSPVVSKKVAVSGATTTVPGVMAFRVALTPGLSTDAASPVNMAAINVYDYVRYKNSGSANYDAPDYMMYLLAMDNLYSAWNWGKRLYGMLSSYNQLNRYLPAALALANFVDFDDLRSHMSDFRAYLNSVGARISAFCVPATMNYMVRHSWMFSNVYKDSDSDKAQSYIFVPDFFYAYDEVTSSQGGQLVPVPVIHGRTAMLKFQDIRSIFETMINALAYSEDIGVMSGDTKKAFTSLFTVSPISEDYQVYPVYSEEVLMQIHNMTMLNLTTTESLAEFNITQDPNTNYILYNPEFTDLSTFQQGSAILNFNDKIKEPAYTMVASRLIYATTEVGVTAANHLKFRSVGSEVVTYAETISYRPATQTSYFDAPVYTNLSMHKLATPTALVLTNGTTLENAEIMAKVVDIAVARSNFDWSPKLWLGIVEPTVGTHTIIGCICDWDVYAQISLDSLDTMNQVAIMSEFDIPTGASF